MRGRGRTSPLSPRFSGASMIGLGDARKAPALQAASTRVATPVSVQRSVRAQSTARERGDSWQKNKPPACTKPDATDNAKTMPVIP
ncbi:MAG: hypothetical protein QHI48_06470 [Bacteroidota bacterium]|nr:hypothetical protein [Bacteroidota bacterium]